MLTANYSNCIFSTCSLWLVAERCQVDRDEQHTEFTARHASSSELPPSFGDTCRNLSINCSNSFIECHPLFLKCEVLFATYVRMVKKR